MTRRVLPLLLLLLLVAPPTTQAIGPPRSGDELPPGARLRIGTTRLRHGGLVRAVAFSPDGTRLASASHDRTASVWAVPSGRELFRCTGHTGDVRCVAFSPDGRLLASGGADGTVRLWGTRGREAGQLLHTFTLRGDAVEALAFAPGKAAGRLLAAGSDDGTLQLLDVALRQPVRQMSQDRGVRCLAWSADGALIATNGASKAVAVWDAANGKALRSFGDELIACLAFAPAGRQLVTWEEGSTLRLWDAASGKEVRRWKGDDGSFGGAGSQIYQIAFNKDGSRVLCGTLAGGVDVWDAATGKRAGGWGGHRGRVTALAVAPAGGLVATGSADCTVRLWDAARHAEVSPQGDPAGPVVSLAVSPRGSVAAVLGHGEVRLWGRDGKPLKGAPKGKFRQVAFRGDELLFLCDGQRVLTHDLRTGKTQPRDRTTSPITDLVLSADGSRVVTSHRDGSVMLTGTDGGGGGGSGVVGQGRFVRVRPAVSATGEYVAGLAGLASVPLWNGRTGELLPALPGHRGGTLAGAFGPSGHLLVTGGRDNAVRFWEAATGGERLPALEGPAWVMAVAVSPTGRVVAAADGGGTISLWSLPGQKRLATYRGHRGPLTGLVFSHDGKALVSGGLDTTIHVWGVPEAEARPAAAAAAVPLGEAKLAALWEELRGVRTAAAYRAMLALSAAPDSTAELLKSRLAAPDGAAVVKLIGRLDDGKYEVREKAKKEIARLGSFAREPLRQALKKKPSLEVAQAVQDLLRPLEEGQPSGDELRLIRALEVLEMIGTPAARALLAEVAKGKNAELAGRAKAALARTGR